MLYACQVNDDSYLQGNWPSFFVQHIMSLPPPYGVIGEFTGNSQDSYDFMSVSEVGCWDLFDCYLCNVRPKLRSDW